MERRTFTDRSLSIVCVALLLEAVIFPPLYEVGLLSRHVADAAFMGAFALVVWLLFDKSRVGRVFVMVAAVSTVLRVANITYPDVELRRGDAWVALAAYSALTWLILIYTLAPGAINVHRILGAIAAFLVMGLAFAQAHRLVAMDVHGAYLLLGQAASYDEIVPKLTYFSFVTLTSLGFGDITPAHPVARAITVFQSLVGVLYPAALLGWVVSMARPGPSGA